MFLLVSDEANYRVDPVWTDKSTNGSISTTQKDFLGHKVPHPNIAYQYQAIIQVVFCPVSQPFGEITCQIRARMYMEGCPPALVRAPLRGTLMTAPHPERPSSIGTPISTSAPAADVTQTGAKQTNSWRSKTAKEQLCCTYFASKQKSVLSHV